MSGPCFYFLRIELFLGKEEGKTWGMDLFIWRYTCPHCNLIVDMNFNDLSCLCFCGWVIGYQLLGLFAGYQFACLLVVRSGVD